MLEMCIYLLKWSSSSNCYNFLGVTTFQTQNLGGAITRSTIEFISTGRKLLVLHWGAHRRCDRSHCLLVFLSQNPRWQSWCILCFLSAALTEKNQLPFCSENLSISYPNLCFRPKHFFFQKSSTKMSTFLIARCMFPFTKKCPICGKLRRNISAQKVADEILSLVKSLALSYLQALICVRFPWNLVVSLIRRLLTKV